MSILGFFANKIPLFGRLIGELIESYILNHEAFFVQN